MKYLILSLILFTGIGAAVAKDTHDQQILKQIEKQCTDATGNKKMCKCAVKAFKEQVPPGVATWVDHPSEHVKEQVVTVPDEYLEALSEDVAACEAANPM